MEYCDRLLEKLTEAEKAIHYACCALDGGSQGKCKDAGIAFALSVASLGEPIAICQGTVNICGEHHDHCWCRVGSLIADPTYDQFTGDPIPFVAYESSESQHNEETFFVFSLTKALRLLEEINKMRKLMAPCQ